MFLRDQGRLKEAMPELRRAAELAPYSVMACVNLAYGLLAEGNVSAALEQARRAVELAPDLASAAVALVRASRAATQSKDADAALTRVVRAASGNPHALSLVACELARLGRRDESLKLVAELESLAQQRYVSPFDLGKVSLALGDGDRALNLLRRGIPAALQRFDLPAQYQCILCTRHAAFPFAARQDALQGLKPAILGELTPQKNSEQQKQPPRVSVVVVSRNRAAMLRRCLESIEASEARATSAGDRRRQRVHRRQRAAWRRFPQRAIHPPAQEFRPDQGPESGLARGRRGVRFLPARRHGSAAVHHRHSGRRAGRTCRCGRGVPAAGRRRRAARSATGRAAAHRRVAAGDARGTTRWRWNSRAARR